MFSVPTKGAVARAPESSLEILFGGFAMAWRIAVIFFGRENFIGGSRSRNLFIEGNDLCSHVFAVHNHVYEFALRRRRPPGQLNLGNLEVSLTHPTDFDVPYVLAGHGKARLRIGMIHDDTKSSR